MFDKMVDGSSDSEPYRDESAETRVRSMGANPLAVSDNPIYNDALTGGINETEGSEVGVVHMEQNELDIRP